MSVKPVIVSLALLCCLSFAAAQGCKSYANLGGWCQESSGVCCGGGPKNSKCVNYVCVSNAPGGGTPAPGGAGCKSFADAGAWCQEASGNCCKQGSKCSNYACVSTSAPAPAPAPQPPTSSGGGCKTFSNIGQKCDEKAGTCCGGGPKNTSCKGGVCVSNYPSGRRMI